MRCVFATRPSTRTEGLRLAAGLDGLASAWPATRRKPRLLSSAPQWSGAPWSSWATCPRDGWQEHGIERWGGRQSGRAAAQQRLPQVAPQLPRLPAWLPRPAPTGQQQHARAPPPAVPWFEPRSARREVKGLAMGVADPLGFPDCPWATRRRDFRRNAGPEAWPVPAAVRRALPQAPRAWPHRACGRATRPPGVVHRRG